MGDHFGVWAGFAWSGQPHDAREGPHGSGGEGGSGGRVGGSFFWPGLCGAKPLLMGSGRRPLFIVSLSGHRISHPFHIGVNAPASQHAGGQPQRGSGWDPTRAFRGRRHRGCERVHHGRRSLEGDVRVSRVGRLGNGASVFDVVARDSLRRPAHFVTLIVLVVLGGLILLVRLPCALQHPGASDLATMLLQRSVGVRSRLWRQGEGVESVFLFFFRMRPPVQRSFRDP